MTKRDAIRMIADAQAAMRAARLTSRLGAYRAALANLRLAQRHLASRHAATRGLALAARLAHARGQMA